MNVLSPITYTTNKIKDYLCLDDHHLRNLMSVSQQEYHSFQNDFSKAPPWAMHSLAVRLGITMENILTGHIDYEALGQHFRGNLTYLPKKYQVYKESRFRTISNLLENIEPNYKSIILNKLQLNEAHMEAPNDKVCGLALIDTQREMRRLGLSLSSIESFGYLSAMKYKDLLFYDDPTKDISPRKLYETVINKINDELERNMNYIIDKESHQSIQLKVTTREELQDNLHIKHFGSIEHCANIQGWMAGILKFKKQNQGSVKKLSCVHQGDEHCLFEVDYSHAH